MLFSQTPPNATSPTPPALETLSSNQPTIHPSHVVIPLSLFRLLAEAYYRGQPPTQGAGTGARKPEDADWLRAYSEQRSQNPMLWQDADEGGADQE